MCRLYLVPPAYGSEQVALTHLYRVPRRVDFVKYFHNVKFLDVASQHVRNKALGKLPSFSWLVYLNPYLVERRLCPLRIRGDARLNVSRERIARQSVHISNA